MSLAFTFIVIVIITIAPTIYGYNETKVIHYLKRYGYLHENNTLTVNHHEVLKHAIALFQEYYQLHGDGHLNNATLHLMRTSRCGLENIPHRMISTEIKKWQKTNLTWNFHLADKSAIEVAEMAFNMWAKHSSLIFTRKIGRAHV
ncbi:PREDICTED: neutrophil collagenase-like [Wasmannia auropunctata]|uniref:neutrophil collagenase-like n=1 Tax=Wasmannia auropunctata TaxID=64793 RepID=UPI0005EE4F54|nr:PREDICTED: neutrophil collagenase-like [Wasmannia auropunctata]